MQTAIICAVIAFYYLLIRAGSKRNWETDICRDQGLYGTIELKYIYIETQSISVGCDPEVGPCENCEFCVPELVGKFLDPTNSVRLARIILTGACLLE
jgi:hypothetical protein